MENNENPASVLVVEDDDHIGELLKFLLERQGYVVTLITDGKSAQEYIQTTTVKPSLVLLDVMLPYVDGFELVRNVRAHDGWDDTPVLMLTAKNMEQDIVRMLDSGANDYIVKPFQPNELLARIRRYLR
jgi:DNA-binding response OmpR family regulator